MFSKAKPLFYAVAVELELGDVLYWPITTRTTLQDGLYSYDAIGRLQETRLGSHNQPSGTWGPDGQASCKEPDIGRFITLGPLGTALLPSEKPRALLIDEIDKSDIDLPNDLLNVFEEGGFDIPELKRMADYQDEVTVFTCDDYKVSIKNGRVLCHAFPFVVLTSNRERELPAPFLRRCLRLDIPNPDDEKLARIVKAHFPQADMNAVEALIGEFLKKRDEDGKLLSTDQLLNAIYLAGRRTDIMSRQELKEAVMRDLNETEFF